MSDKNVEKVTYVRVEKYKTTSIFVLLVEWSDNTASYIGRTEAALQNLKSAVNRKLYDSGNQTRGSFLELKLKEQSFLKMFGPDKNAKALNEFFDTLLRKTQEILKERMIKDFFTIGSSPTLKDFLQGVKSKPLYIFNYEPVETVVREDIEEAYAEIVQPIKRSAESSKDKFEKAPAIPVITVTPSSDANPVYCDIRKPDDDASGAVNGSSNSPQAGLPIYSVVKKKSFSKKEVSVPDVIPSPDEKSPRNFTSAEAINVPPMPQFKPPSLNTTKELLGRNKTCGPQEIRVTAIADYSSDVDHVLSFRAGTTGTLLSNSDQDWWCLRTDAKVGWVPADFWKITSSDMEVGAARCSSAWFVGKISREECEEMMIKYGRQEDFVVRESNNNIFFREPLLAWIKEEGGSAGSNYNPRQEVLRPGTGLQKQDGVGHLALSVRHNDVIRHFPIIVTEDKKFNIGQHDFKSIQNIIAYYKKNALFYSDDNKPVKLGRPLVIVKGLDEASHNNIIYEDTK